MGRSPQARKIPVLHQFSYFPSMRSCLEGLLGYLVGYEGVSEGLENDAESSLKGSPKDIRKGAVRGPKGVEKVSFVEDYRLCRSG